jgi:hypothetical protein
MFGCKGKIGCWFVTYDTGGDFWIVHGPQHQKVFSGGFGRKGKRRCRRIALQMNIAFQLGLEASDYIRSQDPNLRDGLLHPACPLCGDIYLGEDHVCSQAEAAP